MIPFIIASVVIFLICLIVSVLFMMQGPHYVASSDESTKQILAAATKYGAKRIVDLGSGDGKVVIALAKEGFRVDGVELNPWLVWLSRQNLKKAGVEDKAHIYWKSFWSFDASPYDMVVLYVVQLHMGKLEKKLRKELSKGSYVISNYFVFPHMETLEKDSKARVYKF